MAQKNFINIGGQDVKKVAQFNDEGGHNTWRILKDFAKKGEVPISVGFYNANRKKIVDKLLPYLPAASNRFISYAPVGVSFKDANKDVGYHVSVDTETGKKIMVKMPVGKVPLADAEKPKNEWKEVNVQDLVNHSFFLDLGIENGKSNSNYHYDKKEKAHIVEHAPDMVVAAPFITKNGVYELKNGVFVESDLSNPNANRVWRTGENFSGLFALGLVNLSYFNFINRYLIANLQPSYLLGVLAIVAKLNKAVDTLLKAGRLPAERLKPQWKF